MAQELFVIYCFFSFWLGACIASFLNVVIWRTPRGESIVSPPSHCPKCNAPIKWYQNLPIISYLALRGKCANCRAAISPRYILIELLGGLLFLAAFWHLLGGYFPAEVHQHVGCCCGGGAAKLPSVPWPAIANLAVTWIWLSLMIAGTFIDFDHQLLPDFTTVGGMALGLGWGAVRTVLVWRRAPANLGEWLALPIVWSVIGLALGFGLLWLVRHFGSKVFHREAMGMGDVLLLGAVGALYGPVAAVFTMMLSSVYGSLAGLGLIALSRARLGKFVAIPFGPYLCLGCLTWMFFGPQLLDWYLALLGGK